jgi:hypothetical protein
MFLKIVFAVFGILSAFEYVMMVFGWIGGARLLLLLLLVNPLLTTFISRAMLALITRVANTAVHGLAGSGGDPYRPGYSAQEAMVIRGEWQKAAESYREILVSDPGDHQARLRLARLLVRNEGTVEQAEALYLEVRRTDHESRYEGDVSNALIELYRGTGRRAEACRHPSGRRGQAGAAGVGGGGSGLAFDQRSGLWRILNCTHPRYLQHATPPEA